MKQNYSDVYENQSDFLEADISSDTPEIVRNSTEFFFPVPGFSPIKMKEDNFESDADLSSKFKKMSIQKILL